jgi:hypothetical protein
MTKFHTLKSSLSVRNTGFHRSNNPDPEDAEPDYDAGRTSGRTERARLKGPMMFVSARQRLRMPS